MKKHSKNMSRSVEISGSRGTKIVKETGLDNGHMRGDKSMLKSSGMKGGVNDASSSIAGAKTRQY